MVKMFEEFSIIASPSQDTLVKDVSRSPPAHHVLDGCVRLGLPL